MDDCFRLVFFDGGVHRRDSRGCERPGSTWVLWWRAPRCAEIDEWRAIHVKRGVLGALPGAAGIQRRGAGGVPARPLDSIVQISLARVLFSLAQGSQHLPAIRRIGGS